MKDYIFFDLDGTLTDSQEGIINSLKLALNYFNISKTENELRSFIGPSLQDTFQKSLGMNQEDYETAVKIFREYFSTKGLFENKVYEGIPNLLEQLKKSNRHNVVATSKPEKFAKQILGHFKLDAFFDCICGSRMDETRTDKAEVIAYTMECCHLKKEDSSRILMVGDRKNDVVGAHKNGIQVVSVLYGYGTRSEVESAGTDFTVNSVQELKDFLLA